MQIHANYTCMYLLIYFEREREREREREIFLRVILRGTCRKKSFLSLYIVSPKLIVCDCEENETRDDPVKLDRTWTNSVEGNNSVYCFLSSESQRQQLILTEACRVTEYHLH